MMDFLPVDLIIKKYNDDKFAKAIANELDVSFNVDVGYIKTFDEFQDNIIFPYKNGKKIYYRGERIYNRPLIPTIFRDKDFLMERNTNIEVIDSQYLFDFFEKRSNYFELCKRIYDDIAIDNMYPFLAFTQHYLGVSPLIDFTKNPYVAASFALKDRSVYDRDILIYTLELRNDEDYTNSLATANEWIKNYSVLLARGIGDRQIESPENILKNIKSVSSLVKTKSPSNYFAPKARLIDVPTNDLLRYQQGVFLLLDDFTLFANGYLTKSVREDFAIKKWLINKDACPEIHDNLIKSYPYYAYKNITDLSNAVNEIKSNYILL